MKLRRAIAKMPCAWWLFPGEAQKTRLAIRNGFREDMIEAILAAQRPIMEKVAAADFVIWNEGPRTCSASKPKDFTNIFS